ncbi:MAG TPA: acetyl-CoA carboxylase biotin carboxyl carrier protein, partial [Gaiellaceae bacterium]|nr:acetyl-CoA carboxylase biotin carboxyl carrier protein [Gaiellaceae bacterium]
DAEQLLRGIRGRGRRDDDGLSGIDQARAERVRELVQIVQESGIGEVTVEEEGMRVSVRSMPDVPIAAVSADAPLALPEPGEASSRPPANGLVRVESPMVGTFYRAPQPGAPPFVEAGDVIGPGQTLCILEAMKLMNEVKAEVEAVVRAIHVENAEPVEFGQVLFELEPLAGRPLDAV